MCNLHYSLDLPLVDCIMNQTPWTTCDKPCNSGKRRSKQFITQEPKNGGKECKIPKEGEMLEENCNEAPCPGDEWIFFFLLFGSKHFKLQIFQFIVSGVAGLNGFPAARRADQVLQIVNER